MEEVKSYQGDVQRKTDNILLGIGRLVLAHSYIVLVCISNCITIGLWQSDSDSQRGVV